MGFVGHPPLSWSPWRPYSRHSSGRASMAFFLVGREDPLNIHVGVLREIEGIN